MLVFALFSCLTNGPPERACQMHPNPDYQGISQELCLRAAAEFQRQYPSPNHQWRCAGRPSMAWQFVR